MRETERAGIGRRSAAWAIRAIVALLAAWSAPGIAALHAAPGTNLPGTSGPTSGGPELARSGSGARAMTDAASLILASDAGGFAVEDVSGPPGQPLPLRIILPPEAGDLFRVVMFHGVPEHVSLTRGFALGEAWAVSPDDLDGLSLVAPEDYSGAFAMDVIFVHGKGEARERRKMSVRIAAEPARRQPGVPAEMEADMLAKSRQLLEVGDVAGARLVFDFLARQGSARGAFALAQTYDPEFLDSLDVRGGVRADMAKAMQWYREAARLGSEPASTRLGALRAGQ